MVLPSRAARVAAVASRLDMSVFSGQAEVPTVVSIAWQRQSHFSDNLLNREAVWQLKSEAEPTLDILYHSFAQRPPARPRKACGQQSIHNLFGVVPTPV